MNDEVNYKNNPLHGVGLKTLLTEMVDYYGFDILFAYLTINCFKTNPSIESSIKFLKKTEWAREKVEAFYLYDYKNLPRASSEQFELPPRDRVIPEGQVPGEPVKLSLEDAERLHAKRARKAAERKQHSGQRSEKRTAPKRDSYSSKRSSTNEDADTSTSSNSSSTQPKGVIDPWAKSR